MNEVLVGSPEEPTPTVTEIVTSKAEDDHCLKMNKTVGSPGCKLDLNRNGVLVKVSPIDGAVQVVIPQQIQPKV